MAEAGLRQRKSKAAQEGSDNDDSSEQLAARVRKEDRSGISVLDILRVILTLVAVSCGLSYYISTGNSMLWGQRPWFTRPDVVLRYLRGPVHLTPAELSLYNGSNPELPIYVAVNGSIFDVSANPHMYGPGGGYGFFAGRDATRAFVTGCFQDDLIPDLTGIEEMFIPIDDAETDATLSSGEKKKRREQDLRAARQKIAKQVDHWEGFFRNHQKYFEVGKVKLSEEEKARQREAGRKQELCDQARKNRPYRKDLKTEVKKEKQGPRP